MLTIAKLDQQASKTPTSSISHTKNHYIVPNRRVREFVGREDVLAKLDHAFSAGLAQQIVVLRGLGGQGKTQVALEYCRRAKNSGISAIFWIDLTSEFTVRKSYETISEKIKDTGQVIHDESGVEFVREKLGNWASPYLIVFDNYNNPSAFNLQDYMPEGEHSRMVVTSRHADTESLADPDNLIQLHGLHEKEALALLLKQSSLKESESNYQHGKSIIKKLGYHALAITQAGSYVKLQQIGLHQFMEHYGGGRKLDLPFHATDWPCT